MACLMHPMYFDRNIENMGSYLSCVMNGEFFFSLLNRFWPIFTGQCSQQLILFIHDSSAHTYGLPLCSLHVVWNSSLHPLCSTLIKFRLQNLSTHLSQRNNVRYSKHENVISIINTEFSNSKTANIQNKRDQIVKSQRAH